MTRGVGGLLAASVTSGSLVAACVFDVWSQWDTNPSPSLARAALWLTALSVASGLAWVSASIRHHDHAASKAARFIAVAVGLSAVSLSIRKGSDFLAPTDRLAIPFTISAALIALRAVSMVALATSVSNLPGSPSVQHDNSRP